jgi:hypothetical protein
MVAEVVVIPDVATDEMTGAGKGVVNVALADVASVPVALEDSAA